MARGREYTIAELAAATSMTERNIRAYRSRGLVRPPTMRGRVGFYGSSHLAQVRLVQALRGRGLGLSVIARLIQRGVAQTELARLVQDELSAPGGAFPVMMSPVLVADIERARPGVIDAMVEAGICRRRGHGYLADPALLALAQALVAHDVPVATVSHLGAVAGQATAALVHLVGDDPALRVVTRPGHNEARAVLIELATTAFRIALAARLQQGDVSAPAP